ncbi:MAG: glycine dehydrogenase [Euryarchaeota archaeon RBG_16_68_13]|nr:MAG: glycine dehydrogenase [Euryarchaeota archaeon RBG_16_68_13]
MAKRGNVHPYIPNSVPDVREEMLREVGARDADSLYREMIPERLMLARRMRLPEPLTAERDLRRHMESLLATNRTCEETLSFLGGGCWQHYVPAVCDEIVRRSEFLTAYSGGPYSDLGRFQAYFEFQSLMGDLLEMDVVGVTTYDWGAAAGNAIRMASRLTGRREVLVPSVMSPRRLAILRNFAQPEGMPEHIRLTTVRNDPRTGRLDLKDLRRKISTRTAAVYLENPSYLGVIESQGNAISDIAHDHGAESIVGVDPLSLGVLSPPSAYGADIVCGEAQPLGVHMYAGGGLAGFLASRDEERYVAEFPSLLVGITRTERDGEWGFAHCRYDRTSYIARDQAKDWVGTATGLWSIAAATYMALLGPEGFRELGETILQRSHYVARRLSEIRGVRVLFPDFFKEFVVNFDRTRKGVRAVNRGLLRQGIFGGHDLGKEFPDLGRSALYCVTEIHSQEDLDRLVAAVREVVS